MAATPRGEGLLASSKGMLSTLLGILRTRLALLATEVEEEQIRRSEERRVGKEC